MLTWVSITFIPGIEFTMHTGCTWQAVTFVTISDDTARAAVLTWFGVAVGTGEFAIVAVIIIITHANMSILFGYAKATILTWRTITKIHFDLAVTTHITLFAVAVIVVD